MPTSASPSPICLARSSRPARTLAMPATSSSLDGSMPRPTMCTVVLANVTDTSMPSTKGRPAAVAAARAAGRPLSSSWSVSAHSSTPLAFARAASAAALKVPSEAVEWLWRSALRVCTAAILAGARCPCRGKWEGFACQSPRFTYHCPAHDPCERRRPTMHGLHLIADLQGCSGDTPLDDGDALRALCLDAVARAGLRAVGSLFHPFVGED